MNPTIELDRGDQSSGPGGQDTAAVFCFNADSGIREAYDLIAKSTFRYWTEKRKAVKGVMYPYWLVCRADQSDAIEEILTKGGVRWNDMESHFYSAVKDQSTTDQLAGKRPNHRQWRSTKNKWWQFWK